MIYLYLFGTCFHFIYVFMIIGYYLQATPADKSTIIDEISDEETAAGFVTISKFVEDYKKLLQGMNKKNNTEQQN